MKKSIYFAGKIKKFGSDDRYWFFDWRNEILLDDNHRVHSTDTKKDMFFNYTWPYYLREHWDITWENHWYYDKWDVFFRNIDWIDNCDYMFVYLDSNDSFWTIAEIWYANWIWKSIHIYYTKDVDIDELWFVFWFAHSTTKVKDHLQARNLFSKKVLNYIDYKEYLKSDYRKKLSSECKQEAGNKCKLCNSTKRLNVHHRSYDNLRNREKEIKDLIVLCEDCHSKFHNK